MVFGLSLSDPTAMPTGGERRPRIELDPVP
jgi:hypothetical protein